MEMTRSQMEARRVAGFAMLRDGFSGAEVARSLGVSQASVSRWGKLKDPAATKGGGRPPRISRDVIAELIARRSWTGPSLQAEIWKRFRVLYCEDHCTWLLRKERR